ncbi:MAG: hypothetical protein ACRDTG_03210 [Pseudonocardiaceae bacterium]
MTRMTRAEDLLGEARMTTLDFELEISLSAGDTARVLAYASGGEAGTRCVLERLQRLMLATVPLQITE